MLARKLSTKQQRIVFMAALILAGEAVYALPFHLARFFRPTLLDVYGLSATELGIAQGVYGIVAMLAYFPGGPLADRYPARTLLAVSLWSTALGGVYMATFPGFLGAVFIWGFYGITTILCFWAALIRATRDWGGVDEQGRAYGILDSGRGLLAAAMASIGVAIFALSFPDGDESATLAQQAHALRTVICGYTGATFVTGVFVWFALDGQHDKQAPSTSGLAQSWSHIARVARLPAVWLQAMIVVCAYVGYKGFDNYSLFAVQAYGMNEVEAAQIVTLGSWVRPLAALGAGLLGDRFNVSRMLLGCFLLLLVSQMFFAFVDPVAGVVWVLLGNTLISCAAIFGLRGLYFAVFEEARVPAVMTGTAVGIVSFIGYTPDIFVAAVAGYLIDRSPGAVGHQHFFMFLSWFAFLGCIASALLIMNLRHKDPPHTNPPHKNPPHPITP